MNRRTFLKIAGMGSLSFTTACALESEKKLFSLVKTADDMVTGEAHWYASTCRECPAGCGVLAKNREGRVIKLEGNPLHPVNQGKLCMRGQAALQGIYNPDRLKQPVLKKNGRWQPLDYDAAILLLREKIVKAHAEGPNRVRMMSRIEGESLSALFAECLKAWQSSSPLVYEPLACENLKKANEVVFGVNGLAGYRMDQSDFLLGFGADFLETWLSPVEYARRFKAMHAWQNGRKALFYHVGPFRTLTGANADEWMRCPPGGESVIGLGLIKELLGRGTGRELSGEMKISLETISAPYTRQKVAALTGISMDSFDQLALGLERAKHPLVLGTGAMSYSDFDLQANIAANLLNVLLDPGLQCLDFRNRHRVEMAGGDFAAVSFFRELHREPPGVLILNGVNPVYAMPESSVTESVLSHEPSFVVCFSNFMDETAERADLVLPVSLALEAWGEYSSGMAALSTQQPAMPALNGALSTGDVFLKLLGKSGDAYQSFKHYMLAHLEKKALVTDERSWLRAVRSGGRFSEAPAGDKKGALALNSAFESFFQDPVQPLKDRPAFLLLPSIRFFDGRGANLPWLCEIPEPVTKVAWQTPLMVHPATVAEKGLSHGDRVQVKAGGALVATAVYETENLLPGLYAMHLGQGHTAYGRYAKNRGANPAVLTGGAFDDASGVRLFAVAPVTVEKAGGRHRFAHTDGSSDQHGRKIALTVPLAAMEKGPAPEKEGLAMHAFPLTLPLPEGYDAARDFYPPHDHKDYRWAMVVDLDRCIGCNACAAACYAENNLGVVGEQEIVNGREMSWMHIERYQQTDAPDNLIFLPMMCQHCDNAPCESVCPVYAPHHNKEGLNNQIYNRCIGTRFCAQNCPYKVRRFNWHTWQWPEPLNLQLNPDVTVRSKGVMEKCSFCIQRIKAAHNRAKNQERMIRDGEVTPACVQTCPTDALVFGSLMDENSRVSGMVRDRRAYQVMGYLNTKPAVIYLKKVVQA